MIFRRFVQRFRQQQWGAIATELAIVIIGVFIGMQVSNWNAARADARLGRDYVQRLIRDLDQDQAVISAEGAYYADVLESIRKTDELLSSPNPDPRALVVNAYRATEVIYIPTARATWDQIVSSGHLGLLPAGAVESGRLSQYYAFDTPRDIYRMALDSAYRQTVRKIIPLTLQITMRAGCSDLRDKSGNIVGFAKACKLDVDPAALKEVAEFLRSDPAVVADLRYQYSLAVSAVLNLDAARTNITDALTALGAKPKTAAKASP